MQTEVSYYLTFSLKYEVTEGEGEGGGVDNQISVKAETREKSPRSICLIFACKYPAVERQVIDGAALTINNPRC